MRATRRPVRSRPPWDRDVGATTRRLWAFTLIELMVAVSILLVLTAMTFTAINVTMDTDRVRSAARQIQSYVEGARDRAIYAGEPRGVRFLIDATDLTNSTSLVFVGAPEKFTDNWLTVESTDEQTLSGGYSIVGVTAAVGGPFIVRGDITGDLASSPSLRVDNSTGNDGIYTYASSSYDGTNTSVTVVENVPDGTSDGVLTLVGLVPFWDDLRERGLLPDSSRLKIFPATGSFTFTIANVSGVYELSVQYNADAGGAPADMDTPQEYELNLEPVPLPDQEPRLLPRGIVIDLDHSQLPSGWTSAFFDHDSNAATPDIRTYSGRMDVMFSPSGSVTGEVASAGQIHFLLSDVTDVEQFRVPGHPFREQDERIASLTPQTGNVATSEVFRASFWTANTSYDVGDWIVPPDEGDFDILSQPYHVCTIAGTSGAIEPSWGGDPLTDGSAEWDAVIPDEYGTPGDPGFIGPILRFATGNE